MSIICLGDMNGRLKRIEPLIETDCNGTMIENWITDFDMNHLNQTDECHGRYTFISKNGKSAIDHILVNSRMCENYRGMSIVEDRTLLNINVHCLIRTWFWIGHQKKTNWRKKSFKQIKWIKKDLDSYEKFKTSFKKRIRQGSSFDG